MNADDFAATAIMLGYVKATASPSGVDDRYSLTFDSPITALDPGAILWVCADPWHMWYHKEIVQTPADVIVCTKGYTRDYIYTSMTFANALAFMYGGD